MENDAALKFELSAAGLWKLHSHPLGSSDSDRRTTSTTLKKKEQKKPREKVSATHSSNICPSEKLKLILSYLMSLSLMKRLIWAFVAFFTASLESWFYPGNEIKCIEQSPDWRTRAKLYNDEENSFFLRSGLMQTSFFVTILHSASEWQKKVLENIAEIPNKLFLEVYSDTVL